GGASRQARGIERRREESVMRTVLVLLLPLLLLLAARPVLADDDSDRRNIVGVWRLVSVVYEDAETKERTPGLGEHPKGRQHATAQGQWLALVTADRRTRPKTDAQPAPALRTTIAY